MSIEEKINEAEHFAKSPEELELIEGWRKSVQMSGHYKSFLEHPITKVIVERLVSWIHDRNLELLSGVKNEEAIIKRDCFLQLLSLFSPEKTNLINLEDTVDKAIKPFKDYYK